MNMAVSGLGQQALAARFRATRGRSLALVAPLSEADATIQSMDDASPAKWHLAHTTWFWETFLLRDHAPDYRLFDDRWPYLFNSYYEAEGARLGRPRRGMLSRPTLAEIAAWRHHVDAAMEPLLGDERLLPLIALGVAHEEQHQELLLTDIKHALFQNPLGVAYDCSSPLAGEEGGAPAPRGEGAAAPVAAGAANPSPHPLARTGRGAKGWHHHPGGIVEVGHTGLGFAFDNEGPRHQALLQPFALADRLVTNGEWDAFIADGGYRDARLWLADGWGWVQAEGIAAPLYWREGEHYTLSGWQTRDPNAPVTHVSAFEADAYATWAGNRLPTEFEWEAVAQAHDPSGGNQMDEAGPVAPVGSQSLFGDVWQFTRSAYLPYPGFRPVAGAVGEYNGKFMSGQVVLRGASCATVRGHSRSCYRNFFYPHQRWQFTGVRLAKDMA